MAKKGTLFCCKSCGYETQKWLGRCPGCSEWNTMTEFKPAPLSKRKSLMGLETQAEAISLKSVPATDEERMISRISQRINEAVKLGFKRFVLPQANLKEFKKEASKLKSMQLIGVDNIKEAIGIALL